MAYVPVPKDLTKIKTKVMFNLTKRQLICFSLAAVAGIPLFFLLKAHTSVSAAALMMVLSMLPFFMFALYEKNGQPLEVLLRHIIQARFLRPKQRLYRTDKEVKAIVTGKEKARRARKA